MPLSAVNIQPTLGLKAADVHQFFDLLTGVMTDQPVSLVNTLSVGGSQGAGSVPLKVAGVAAQTANMAELRTLAADVQPVFSIDKTGKISWGPGGGVAPDTSLSRTALNTLTFAGNLILQDTSLHTTFSTVSGSGAAVNYLSVKNAATGVSPELDALGTDTDVGVILRPKGVGVVTVPTGFVVTGTATFNGGVVFNAAITAPVGIGVAPTASIGLWVDVPNIVAIEALTGGGAGIYAGIFQSNGSASNNNGIKIQAGSTASDFSLRVLEYSGGSDHFVVRGDGLVQIPAGTGPLSASVECAFGVGNIGNTATTGFVYISSGGGSPSGVPTLPYTGLVPMRYDTSTNKLWVYNSGWKGVVLA